MCVRSTAKQPFGCSKAFNRYLISGEGDVKQLQGKENEFRLRLRDYRLCFTPEGDLLHVHWVRHRGEAYR